MNEAPPPDAAVLPGRRFLTVSAPPYLTGKATVLLLVCPLALAIGLAPLLGASAGWIAVFAFPLLLVATSIPAKLVIGSDGIAVEWLFRRVFLPYAALVDEQRTEHGVRLLGSGGRTLDLRCEGPDQLLALLRKRKSFPYSVQGMLAEEALLSDASLLSPAGTPDAWAERLRRMGQGDYRSGSLPRERLLSVVATPSLAPELRAAAAVALGPPANDDEARVLAQVIRSTASRTLERALRDASMEDLTRAKAGLARVLLNSQREAEDRRRGSE